MHPAAYDYVTRSAREHVPVSKPYRVVEFGSCDVNGSVRDLFPGAHYHGIDTRPGPGVDEVADATTWRGKKTDVVVCTETLEHAPDPEAIIKSARRALRPGGLLVATMAAPERAPHCVNGGHTVPEGEHYKGISESELRAWLKTWEILSLVHDPSAGDLYVTARR